MSITAVDRPAVRVVKALDISFMVANMAGVAIYLVLASRSWSNPIEHGEIPISGEPFVWVLALPVLAVFLLANTVWGGLLLRARESKRWLWWLLAGAVWLLAIGIDFYHH